MELHLESRALLLAEVAAAIDLACAFGLIGKSELAATKSRLKLASVQIKALP